jgi:hypothetical protein
LAAELLYGVAFVNKQAIESKGITKPMEPGWKNTRSVAALLPLFLLAHRHPERQEGRGNHK